ncbi:MAG: anhydro-N-acetylmuramic acid kinase [Methylacidiphilales bacterium]|nr:anhydro-N-acetylmuramic acid kinase [Candidatus Methylacidiphilales bacterium]
MNNDPSKQVTELERDKPRNIVGLMTGTSLDGVDYVLVECTNATVRLLDSAFSEFNISLKNRLRQLRESGDQVSLQTCYGLSQEIAKVCCEIIDERLRTDPFKDLIVHAIGYQGQTIRHQPLSYAPFSFQLIDADLINSVTAIPVISGFRQSDIANGGQGAPLTPAFHRTVFAHNQERRAVINLGGIANVTFLPTENSESMIAFDTGPGNTLIDEWCRTQYGMSYDAEGLTARKGNVQHTLLEELLSEAYFHQRPPKSTGQEYFNIGWLQKFLNKYPHCTKGDILSTLVELTAQTCVQACQKYGDSLERIIICGGGVKNNFLMERITAISDPCLVERSDGFGIPSDYCEAMAFAYFADCKLRNISIDLSSVTGSRTHLVHGSITDCYGTLTNRLNF